MLQAAVAVLLITLLYTGFALFADRFPSQYGPFVFWSLPFILFGAIAWAFAPQRKRRS